MQSECAKRVCPSRGRKSSAKFPLVLKFWVCMRVTECACWGAGEPQGGGVFQFQGKQIFKSERTKQGKLGVLICITKGFFVSPTDSQQDFFK